MVADRDETATRRPKTNSPPPSALTTCSRKQRTTPATFHTYAWHEWTPSRQWAAGSRQALPPCPLLPWPAPRPRCGALGHRAGGWRAVRSSGARGLGGAEVSALHLGLPGRPLLAPPPPSHSVLRASWPGGVWLGSPQLPSVLSLLRAPGAAAAE